MCCISPYSYELIPESSAISSVLPVSPWTVLIRHLIFPAFSAHFLRQLWHSPLPLFPRSTWNTRLFNSKIRCKQISQRHKNDQLPQGCPQHIDPSISKSGHGISEDHSNGRKSKSNADDPQSRNPYHQHLAAWGK